MLSLMRRSECNNIATIFKIIRRSIPSTASIDDDTEFRILQLIPDEKKSASKRKQVSMAMNTAVPKANTMSVDQSWQAVWPSARTFHPDTVPLPLRQGYKNPKGIHPDKYANAELMKIPNFLHLTPPVVKRHCDALKKFCTKWPEELQTEAACEKYFPVEIITSDYCYSSPTIREPHARVASLKVKLSSLYLNAHAKDKILRLLGDKYNHQTDVVTITADRCPTKKQNLDYVKYLLTALFHVSWRVEPWEAEKSEADMEYYDWDKSKSKESLTSVYSWPMSPVDTNYECIPHATEYKIAVSNLMNTGEDQLSINKYKEAVKNVLNLQFNESK